MAAIYIAEVKVRVKELETYRKLLGDLDAKFVGIDHQKDTYYQIKQGRLKLRQGSIESTLIYYSRPNQFGHKKSEVKYQSLDEKTAKGLESILAASHEIKTVVNKTREIYWIDHTKFHLDIVDPLGSFVEIEVMNTDNYDKAYLHQTLDKFIGLLKLNMNHCVPESYSDLVL